MKPGPEAEEKKCNRKIELTQRDRSCHLLTRIHSHFMLERMAKNDGTVLGNLIISGLVVKKMMMDLSSVFRGLGKIGMIEQTQGVGRKIRMTAEVGGDKKSPKHLAWKLIFRFSKMFFISFLNNYIPPSPTDLPCDCFSAAAIRA
jgi:hypothetical protein